MAKTSIGNTALFITLDDTKLNEGFGRATRSFDKFRAKIDADARAMQKKSADGFGLAGTRLDGFRKQLDSHQTNAGKGFDITGALAKMLPGPLGIAGSLTGLVGGIGLGAVALDAVKLAASFEDTTTTFKVMLGDAGKAKTLFHDIQQYAAETPLTTIGLAESAKALLAVGVGMDQIVPTLQMLGDVAQGDDEKLKEISIIYGKIRSDGALNGRELMQMTVHNVPLVDALAKSMKVSASEIHKMVEEGKVGFPDVQRALVALTSQGGQFFNLMKERSKTLSGLWSTLKDNWEIMLGKVGQIGVEELGLKDFLGKVSDVFGAAGDDAESLRPAIKEAAEFAKEMAKDLYDGAFEFAKLMGQAKDSMGELKEIWRDIKAAPRQALLNPVTGLMALSPVGAGKNDRTLMNDVLDAHSPASGRGRAEQWVVDKDRKIRELLGMGTTKADMDAQAKQIRDFFGGEDPFGLADKFEEMGREMGFKTGKGFIQRLGEEVKKATRQFKVEADKLSGDDIKHVASLRKEMDPVYALGQEMTRLNKIRNLGGFNDVKGVLERGGLDPLNQFVEQMKDAAGATKLYNFAVEDATKRLENQIVRGLKDTNDPFGKIDRERKDLQKLWDRGAFFDPKALAGFGVGGLGPLAGMGEINKGKDAFQIGIAKIIQGAIPHIDFAKPMGIAEAGSAEAVNALINAQNRAQFSAKDKVVAGLDALKLIQAEQLKQAKVLNDMLAKRQLPGIW